MSDQSFQQLKELIIHLPKSSILAGASNANGRYKFYLSGKKIGKIDEVTTNLDAIIMGDGGVASIAFATGEYSYSSHNFGFYSKTENYLTEYLFRALEKFLPNLDYMGFVGSGIKNIDKTFLFDLYIQKIPIHEQKEIVSALTSVDEVIENIQKQIDKLQDLKKATMNELLTKGIGHTEFKDSELGRIPKSWEVRRLGDLCDKTAPITYGVLKPGEYIQGGIPLLQVKDLSNGTVLTDDLHRISKTLDREYIRSRIQSGDVLISLIGTVGRVALVPKLNETYNIHRNIGRIRVQNPDWVSIYLQSPRCVKQIILLSSGSSQSALNLSELKELLVPQPPLEEKFEILKLLQSVTDQCNVQKQKLCQTQSLKKSLMQDLLAGKVRVQVN